MVVVAGDAWSRTPVWAGTSTRRPVLSVTPGLRLSDGRHDGAARPHGTRNDHHGDAQVGGRIQLGRGVGAAGVLGDQQIDSVVDQDLLLVGIGVWTAGG